MVGLPALSFGLSFLAPATTFREIRINASPGVAWAVLIDVDSDPDGNPVLTIISGTPAEGETLAFTTKVDNGDMSFQPTVLATIPNQVLRWLGQLWFSRLADGEHSFILPAQDDGTHLVQEESFTGILAPPLPLFMDLGDTFELSNDAIRTRSEVAQPSNQWVPR